MVGAYGDMIELDEKWAYNIVKQVGNYKEIFSRNLGSKSILNLDRGLNKLYSDGGLLFTPPFRQIVLSLFQSKAFNNSKML